MMMFTNFDILCARINISLREYYSSDEIKKNEMGRTRDTYGGDERCTQGYDGDLRGKDILEEVGGDGRVKLKEI